MGVEIIMLVFTLWGLGAGWEGHHLLAKETRVDAPAYVVHIDYSGKIEGVCEKPSEVDLTGRVVRP